MATIMCLPDEVIDIILGNNDITIEDIINFRCVCKQFQWAAKYDNHWKKKFSQRWPSAKKLYDKQSKENEQKDSAENKQKDKDSLNFIEIGINCTRQLRIYVSQIIHHHYEGTKPFYARSINNIIKLQDVFYLNKHLRNYFDEIIFKPENILKYSFFIDEIKNLLTQPSRRTGCDLTERYCNTKIMHHLRQRSRKKKWDKFKKKPARKQLLERAATIVSQWIQFEKDVFYSCVKASLDSMALEVLNCLREKHPDHSIFSTSAETYSYWKNNNIDDNYWNEAEGTQIMDTLQEYIFGKLNFRPNIYNKNSEYRCIDNVLKNKYGDNLILCIIYHSVARRLGLRCDVINIPYNLSCIFWKPKYATHNLENIRCFTLSDEIEKFPDCLINKEPQFTKLYSGRSFLDDFLITNTNNVMWRETIYMLELSLTIYRENQSRFRNLDFWFGKGEIGILRSEDVKFAIGMIVTHRDQSTDNCTGVIIGWHRHIDSHVYFDVYLQNEWYYTDIGSLPLNHFRNSNFEKQQTNYIILTDKNEMCYVEEDTITLTTPRWIENSEIGRYFCKFEDTHYVPNKMLASFYPQDAAITAAINATITTAITTAPIQRTLLQKAFRNISKSFQRIISHFMCNISVK